MTPRTLAWLGLGAAVLASSTASAQNQGDFVEDSPYWQQRPGLPPADPRPPRLPDAPGPAFGEAGEWVVTGASSLGASWTQYDNSSATNLSISVSPGVDLFVVRNLSLGVGVDATYSDVKGYDTSGNILETKSTGLQVSVRIGYNLPLGKTLSLWPRLSFGPFYDSAETKQDPDAVTVPVTVTPQVSGVGAALFVPLLLHPAPHFFVGLGPYFSHAWSPGQSGLAGLGDTTAVYGEVVVGGFWGGPPVEQGPAAAPPPEPDAVPPRFGDRGNVVLTGEFTGSGGATTYTGTGGKYWSVGLGPGFDYFVADHISLGFAASLSTGGGSGTDLTAVSYSYRDTSFGFVPRFGVELPLGSRFSLYPRATLGISHSQDDHTDLGKEEHYTTDEIYVGLYAPVLVHLASHAFAGFGPFVTRDVSESTNFVSGGSESLPGTRAGASLLVGGWL